MNQQDFFEKPFLDFFNKFINRDYALRQVHVIEQNEMQCIRIAAKKSYQIFEKTLDLLCGYSDEVLEGIGIPKNMHKAVRLRYANVVDTVIGRFDFIMSQKGPKVIEFNAQTPYFNIESHRMNGLVANSLGYDDPNEGTEQMMGAALAEASQYCKRNGRLVVVGHTVAEDAMTARYVAAVIQKYANFSVDFSAVQHLYIKPDGLYDNIGKIDVMYSFYPLELFSLDPGGPQLFELLVTDKLRLINPPASLLLQNKVTLAFIWGLYEQNKYFNAEERETIERFFLPTYAILPEDTWDYVRKPLLGREGNSVTIIRRDGSLLEGTGQHYVNQPAIFQRYITPPQIPYIHPSKGPTVGYAIHTCFVANKQPTAVGMRIGHEITDLDSHFFPLGYRKKLHPQA